MGEPEATRTGPEGGPRGPAAPKAGASKPRAHFIPFRKADVVEMCASEGSLPEAERASFREFCRVLESVFHFEYHSRVETLKDAYAPMNPDSDTQPLKALPKEARREAEAKFVPMLREVLKGANYEELSREEIEGSLDEETRFKVRLVVDLDDYEEVRVFRRGRRKALETRTSLMGLRKESVPVEYYERVVVYLKFRDQAHFDARGRKDLPFTPGESTLKLLKNVPVEDMEMLFPNARMKMRLKDMLFIGVPAAVGSFGALAKLSGAILVIAGVVAFWVGLRKDDPQVDSKQLVALGLAFVAVGGFVMRQIGKVKTRKLRYLMHLSTNLFFKLLDNNAGVFHHLVDAAEEEDCKEAILAYYFLLTKKTDLTERQLDEKIERWFESIHRTSLDFEVDDAVAKLERLELASREGEKLSVKQLAEAKERLDYVWDHYFEFSGA